MVKRSVIFVLSSLIAVSYTDSCYFNVKVKQALRNEGFHRDMSPFEGWCPGVPGNGQFVPDFEFFGKPTDGQPSTDIVSTRNITYEIMFNQDGNEEETPLSFEGCILGLDQILPSGVYANPDELGDLKRANKLHAIPKNPINIELPAEQSAMSNVYILGKVAGDILALWLPVHARYHQATPGGGMVRNEIPPPRLLARCPDARFHCAGADSAALPALCNGGDCWRTYKHIPYAMMTDTLIWEIPVGDTDHYYPVAGGTALVIIVGSLYLLKSVHQYKRARI